MVWGSAGAPPPLPPRLRSLAALARALDACHRQGVVHRDVKPENVMVVSDENGLRPVLVDFGLGYVESRSGSTFDLSDRLLGTAAYIAPEQVAEQRIGSDPKSEQFSFGCIAYELLVGEQPFARPSVAKTLAAVSSAAPRLPRTVAPELPRDVELILLH